MDNNSKTATPVNLEAYEGTDPIPVTFTPDYPVLHQRFNGGALVTTVTITPLLCQLECVAGYNSDPVPTNLLFVQLHNANAVNPGDAPDLVIPVYGGKSPYSLAMPITFPDGLTLALSSTELTFTPASALLAYYCVYRTPT